MAVLLPVTLTAAGGAALINFWLAVRIGQVRMATKIIVGDGGHEPLIRRMRAQANFVEFAPFILLLIGLIEFTSGTSLWLWVAAAAFLIARVLHGVGMDGWRLGRSLGTGITFTLLVGLGAYALALPYLYRDRPRSGEITVNMLPGPTAR